jgi:parallel beta-helix repeat protein
MCRVRAFLLLLTAAISAACVPACSARTYHVDAGKGKDTNPGTADAPWKTITQAALSLEPGDIALIKAGVYRESVAVRVSGNKGSPITFRSYPGETVILEGAVPVTGWTRCNAKEPGLMVNGVINPDYANIYRAEVEEGDIGDMQYVHILENGHSLQIAQEPDQTAFGYEDITEYWTVPDERGNYGQNRFLADSAHLNQADDYWNGAWVFVWMYNLNNAVARNNYVNDFVAAENKLVFAYPLPKNLSKRPDRYAIVNHPHVLDKPGEFCHSIRPLNGKYRIYVWPRDPADLSGRICISKYKAGFAFARGKGSYVTIDGFEIRGFANGHHYAGTVTSWWNNPHKEITVRNCTIHDNKIGTGIHLAQGDGDVVENNKIYNIELGYGILLHGTAKNAIVRNNTVYDTERTAIRFQGVDDSQIVGNKVGGGGCHHNAISVYTGSDNVLVAHNIVKKWGRAVPNRALTISGGRGGSKFYTCSDVIVYGNVLYGVARPNVAIRGGLKGTVLLLNNVIQGRHLEFYKSDAKHILRNNIIAGGRAGSYSHNIYTALKWNQDPSEFGRGGRHENDLLCDGKGRRPGIEDIFVDPDKHNYGLKKGSPGIDKGVNVSAIVEALALKKKFPDFDFNRDIAGNRRPLGAAYDIGPYEYVPRKKRKLHEQ